MHATPDVPQPPAHVRRLASLCDALSAARAVQGCSSSSTAAAAFVTALQACLGDQPQQDVQQAPDGGPAPGPCAHRPRAQGAGVATLHAGAATHPPAEEEDADAGVAADAGQHTVVPALCVPAVASAPPAQGSDVLLPAAPSAAATIALDSDAAPRVALTSDAPQPAAAPALQHFVGFSSVKPRSGARWDLEWVVHAAVVCGAQQAPAVPSADAAAEGDSMTARLLLVDDGAPTALSTNVQNGIRRVPWALYGLSMTELCQVADGTSLVTLNSAHDMATPVRIDTIVLSRSTLLRDPAEGEGGDGDAPPIQRRRRRASPPTLSKRAEVKLYRTALRAALDALKQQLPGGGIRLRSKLEARLAVCLPAIAGSLHSIITHATNPNLCQYACTLLGTTPEGLSDSLVGAMSEIAELVVDRPLAGSKRGAPEPATTDTQQEQQQALETAAADVSGVESSGATADEEHTLVTAAAVDGPGETVADAAAPDGAQLAPQTLQHCKAGRHGAVGGVDVDGGVAIPSGAPGGVAANEGLLGMGPPNDLQPAAAGAVDATGNGAAPSLHPGALLPSSAAPPGSRAWLPPSQLWAAEPAMGAEQGAQQVAWLF